MSWLAIHIWLELLMAAVLGGLIGWALYAYRHGQLSVAGDVTATADPAAATPPLAAAASAADANHHVRLVELETQLRQERDAASALRNQLAAAKKADPANAQPVEEDATSLSWRNRYLESRVRFLEGKVSDLEIAAAPAAPPEDINDDATRLRWRNRYLEGRVKYLEEELLTATPTLAAAPVLETAMSTVMSTASLASLSTRAAAPEGAAKPAMLTEPRGGTGDDLKQIAGIGPKLEKALNGLGVYHFDQIAAWTQAEIDWVNAAISFRGRIEREKWVEQADQLAKGVVTDGQQKYEQGRPT